MLFASHAAIAVKNSRLYEQARAEIAARERLERQIEERRRYLEHVLACAPDAIVTLDPEHRVLEWNPGAEALFGGWHAGPCYPRWLPNLYSRRDGWCRGRLHRHQRTQKAHRGTASDQRL